MVILVALWLLVASLPALRPGELVGQMFGTLEFKLMGQDSRVLLLK